MCYVSRVKRHPTRQRLQNRHLVVDAHACWYHGDFAVVMASCQAPTKTGNGRIVPAVASDLDCQKRLIALSYLLHIGMLCLYKVKPVIKTYRVLLGTAWLRKR